MIRNPRDCTSMAELREEIDRVDAELVALIARRVACIDRAAQLKRAAGLPARITPRVEA
jgi:isochorismate pyruvate lyase